MSQPVVIRRFAWGDLPALVGVINAAAAFDGDDQSTTFEALRARFEVPGFEPEANCFVAVLPEDRVVGYCTAELDPRSGRAWGAGAVRPDVRNRGIGMRLIRAAAARFRERAESEVAPALPVAVLRYTRDTNAAAVALLEREGYTAARSLWFMRRDLDELPDPPALPGGVALHPFVRTRDMGAVYEAERAIFRDNWGYAPLPFDAWTQSRLGMDFDPGLWLVAVAGDAIAGLCLGGPWGGDQPTLGWISAFGVVAGWRGHGLGTALLWHGFHALRNAGFSQAGLEVDAENTSNAVALYERAGMRVYRRYVLFQKTLRG